MVFDRLEAAPRYFGLHPLFERAFDQLNGLARNPGRHPIVGEALYASVDEAMTEARDARRFESHRRYIDIQVSLTGGEIIDWAPEGALPIEVDFQAGGDIAFHRAPAAPAASLRLVPGSFAIFFPGEAHRPLCALESGPDRVRKVVFKVAAGYQPCST